MFARRLSVSLAALATVAVIQGIAAVWALNVAHEHVLRGRLASDIELAFKDMSVTKLRLRGWFTQAQLDPGTPVSVGLGYAAEMKETMDRLRALSARAVEIDRGDATRAEHLQRQDALSVLIVSVDTLAKVAADVRPLEPGADTRQAWQSASELFDVSRGRDLRRLLSESIEREARAVARERAGADEALAWMRALWMVAAACVAMAALILGWVFARALRRPLEALSHGAKALQSGDLSHRIALEGSNEFSVAARSMNSMAAELAEHRAREAQARHQLEGLVTARTSELQGALQTLQDMDTRRRQLFADISHELRTPTTAIKGEAEITLRGKDRSADEYRTALQRIVSTARELAAVIDDLLTMARTDIDVLTLHRSELDLKEPLQQAVDQARSMAREREIDVALHLDSNEPIQVLADPQRLRQLFLLLLDNAVRYSNPGGRVDVHVRCGQSDTGEGRHCEVSIADQGIGIAQEELPRLFERHFRGARARAHSPQGSGLGLGIGRALARAQGASITLEGNEAQGATARLVMSLQSASSRLHQA